MVGSSYPDHGRLRGCDAHHDSRQNTRRGHYDIRGRFGALPAGILATGLANELAQRRDELEQQFREFLVDGDFDLVQNQTMIDKIRRELGLDKEQAQDIVLQVLREQELERREKEVRKKNFCPHCGEALD